MQGRAAACSFFLALTLALALALALTLTLTRAAHLCRVLVLYIPQLVQRVQRRDGTLCTLTGAAIAVGSALLRLQHVTQLSRPVHVHMALCSYDVWPAYTRHAQG